MRENASLDHPIIITTHSESVIRKSRAERAVVCQQARGENPTKHASDAGIDKKEIPLDTAWLMNMFDGGLPW